MAKFEIYRDKASEYRWRLIANNHQIIATSSEGYINKSDCDHSIKQVKNLSLYADTEEASNLQASISEFQSNLSKSQAILGSMKHTLS
jgi:uncharacterized protein YegP (UPF0339 family)